MSWHQALLTSDHAPDGIITPQGTPALRRFDVYRNNVTASLATALEDGFPTIARLVGHDFFAAMAVEFIRAHPPRSPILSTYGADFPAFLTTFPPIAHLPYLADTARLELALRRAYHAADTRPVSQKAFAHPGINQARLTLGPAIQIMTSPYPIHGIWRANQDPRAPKPTSRAETVLISRPDWDPMAEVIPPSDAIFIDHLRRMPLAEAAEQTPDLDLAGALARLIARKAIIAVEFPT